MKMTGRVQVVGTATLLACAVAVRAAQTQPQSALPDWETRAVGFLVREVPKWKAENDCYSCHNNGDAARALIAAKRSGHDIGVAMDDTIAWLREPRKWDDNKTEGGIDDKPLARVQFAGALRLAVDADLAPARALDNAAAAIVRDQRANGSWQLDISQSIGSPTTYGTTLATWAAKRSLQAAGSDAFTAAVTRADAWLRTTNVETVVDAAAVVLALQTANDPAAHAQRERALATLRDGQAPSGGWGPYVTVSAEVFDTALVILALDEILDAPQLAEPVFSVAELRQAMARGKRYLLHRQMPDGSWPETTRPSGQESYAQRISTTGWALLALLETRDVSEP